MRRSLAGLMIVMGFPLAAFGDHYTRGPAVQLDQDYSTIPCDLRSAGGAVTWQCDVTIRAFDFDSNRLVTVSSNDLGVYRPDTSGKVVLWTEPVWNGSDWYWQIMRYDLVTGTRGQVTSDASQKGVVSVDSGTAVFEKYDSDGYSDIFMAKSPHWSPVPLVQGATGTTCVTPDVSQGRLLYQQGTTYTASLRVLKIATGQTVWQHAASTSCGVPPRIEGDVVGWIDYSDPGQPLRVDRIGTGEEWLLNTEVFALREDAVVYIERNMTSISLLDLTDGSVSVLGANLVCQGGFPGGIALDGDRLTWVDSRAGQYVVLSAEIILEPATLSLLALGLGAAAIGRRRAR
jgi:hypothetical protein